MLAGEQPFTGPTLQAMIAKRFVQTPADVSALRERCPRQRRARGPAGARRDADRSIRHGARVVDGARERDSTARQAPRARAPEKSIAVLPFANLSADRTNEFFADGITEEIINALVADRRAARRGAHVVRSHSRARTRISARSASELNVRTVLEGSVRRAASGVRITAQLIDVADGYQLWSERYDREIEDVFAVQDEIASAIAGEDEDVAHRRTTARSQRATDNIEAYEAYLKGRALLYRRGPAIKLGLALMEKALQLDPEYALAWAGIADTYTMLGYYGQLDS